MFTDTPPTIFRLNMLIKAGFKIMEQQSQHLETELELKHPSGRRFSNNEITLYSCGLVVGRFKENQLRIEPEEEREFKEFIKSVPKPTLLEQTLDLRVKIFIYIFFISLFFGPLINNIIQL